MKAIFILIFSLLLSGCGGGPKGAATTPEQQRLEEKAAILSKIIEGIDTLRLVSTPAVQQVAGLQAVMDSVLVGKAGYGMFYLLNSGCSVCIAELIDFGHTLKRTGLEIPVYVIPSSRSHVSTIEYYLEQPELESDIEIRVIRHLLPGGLISDRNKTVVVTYGGQPVEQFVFR